MISSQVGRGMTKALAVVCSLLAFFEVSAGSYRLQRIQHGALEELCGNFSEGGEAADAVPAEEREVLGTFCRALNATCPERHFCRDLELKNGSNASSLGQNDNTTGRAEVCAALDRTSLWVQVADDLPSEQQKLCTRLGKAMEERYQRRDDDEEDDDGDDDEEERLCESSGQDDADDEEEKNSTTSANHTEQGNGTSRGQLFPEEDLLALCEEFGLLLGHQEPGDRDGDGDDSEEPQRDGDDDDAEDPQHGDRDGDDDDEDGEANSTQNEDGDGVEDEISTSTFTSEVESSSASAVRGLAAMSICCASLFLRIW